MLQTNIRHSSFFGSEKKNFKLYFFFFFFTINLAWRSSWLTDRNHLYKFKSPINRRLQEKFEENWPRGFRRGVVQRCGRTDDRRTDGGPTTAEEWHISGSGELKIIYEVFAVRTLSLPVRVIGRLCSLIVALPATCFTIWASARQNLQWGLCDQRRLTSLRIRAVWSGSLLIACAFYRLQGIQKGLNKNPCHNGWMYRLICHCWSHRSCCRFCRALVQFYFAQRECLTGTEEEKHTCMSYTVR